VSGREAVCHHAALLVPPAGAGASTFATWGRIVRAWIEVLVLMLAGR
jgi:surfactin synthase thioesterase subunit